MPHIKKNKKVDYELKLDQKEMEIVAVALESLHRNMARGERNELEIHIDNPAHSSSPKRVMANGMDLEKLRDFVGFIIEEHEYG